MTREEYRRTVKSGGMYTTRDVYGNPRFIIHFLDLVHEDHPGDHCDKMESARRIAKYETNDGHLFDTREEAVKHIDASIGTLTSRISHALLNKKWSEIGDWVLDNLKTFKELIDLNNELNDETDE